MFLEWKLERERWKVQWKEEGRAPEPGETLALGRVTREAVGRRWGGVDPGEFIDLVAKS